MKTIKEIPVDWLCCPFTKSSLTRQDGKLVSEDSVYHNANGYWDFFPEKKGFLKNRHWKLWQQLQENGEVSYNEDPEANLAIGPLKEFIDFIKFSNFNGKVLDIGVGPQKIPTHMEYCDNNDVVFVGVDPLVGRQPRDFIFVRALGEYLPFRDKLFDQVLFVTSLDHFLDPVEALQEARRVTAASGEILVVMGEKYQNPHRPIKSANWYEKLVIPEGADDKFHLKKFDTKEFESFVKEAGLTIADIHKQKVRDWTDKIHDKIDYSGTIWGESLFYRLKKSF